MKKVKIDQYQKEDISNKLWLYSNNNQQMMLLNLPRLPHLETLVGI